MSNFLLRPISSADRDTWLDMLRDYDPEISAGADYAWSRLIGPSSQLTGVIAEVDGDAVGFMHYLFHEFSLMRGPVCYVADLYVRPQFRRRGIARAMLEQLIERGRNEGWMRIYWVTEHSNPARVLYDHFAAPDFIRYHIDLRNEYVDAK